MPQKLVNLANSLLQSDINGSVTSLTIDPADQSKFPEVGDYVINVEGELMSVTARSGNTLTVQRGIESTSAVPHLAGVPVRAVLSAGAANAFVVETTGVDSLNQRPAVASSLDDEFRAASLDPSWLTVAPPTGSAYMAWSYGSDAMSASFSGLNQNTVHARLKSHALQIGQSIKCGVKYAFGVKTFDTAARPGFGLVISNGTTSTSRSSVFMAYTTSTQIYLTHKKGLLFLQNVGSIQNSNTWENDPADVQGTYHWGDPRSGVLHLKVTRFADNGSSAQYGGFYSADGMNWLPHSVNYQQNANLISPTHIGVGILGGATNGSAYIAFEYFRVE